MQHRVNNTENIEVLYNTEVDEVLGEQVVEGLRMVNNTTQEKTEIPITGLFIAIGHQPNTDIFKGQLDMDDAGYLITEGKSTKTNLPGVFASGDVQDKEYRRGGYRCWNRLYGCPRCRTLLGKLRRSLI